MNREVPTYRGRFAPSPTGPLHFGSLVAAIGSFLEARAQGGAWLLRIEDLDRPRCVPGAEADIRRTLDALGLQPDGEVLRQSERDEAYAAALDQLDRLGKTYGCACTRREIADSALAGIDGPVYPGTCRSGLAAGREARASRVRCDGAVINFDDHIQGHIRHDLEHDIGDFVLKRADGLYAYQLAVVVDDAAQGITDIVRGADLLDSSTRQIHLQRLLGFPVPRYAHLPVAVNAQGEKLSKQTLAAAVDVREPVALLNRVLEFLGQTQITDCGPADLDTFWPAAIAGWRLDRVPRCRSRTTVN